MIINDQKLMFKTGRSQKRISGGALLIGGGARKVH